MNRQAVVVVTVAGLLVPAILRAAQDARATAAELKRVTLASDSVRPQVSSKVLRDYPADAAGARGTVEVEAVVGTKGDVIHARVSKTPDPSGALGRAALEAARVWNFKPMVTGRGDRLTVLVLLKFEFEPPRAAGQASKVSARLAALQLTPLPGGGRQLPTGSAPPLDARTGQEGMQEPRLVRQVIPSYTPNAMRAKKQGVVRMEAVILDDGSVVQTRVTQPLFSDLDEQALIAARYWHFEPGTRDGKPVTMRVVLELEFKLH